MRVAIAGAGAVGRSIARELLDNGHEVLLIDKNPRSIKVDSLPRAEWLLADAAEITSLDEAGLERCNVVICATGDDKVNLVVSLLAKTEYGVPRVVARINHPNNEWLFNESWGVDVAVSTPRLLSALVEEAVSVGDLVRLMTFRQSEASLVEMTIPDDAPLAGSRIGDISWPADTALVAILRAGRVIVPQADDPLAGGDELLFVASEDVEEELGRLLGRALSRRGGSLTGLGDFRAVLERAQPAPPVLLLCLGLIGERLEGLGGELYLQHVPWRHRVIAAGHHDIGEHLLQRYGDLGPQRRGPADHAAEEPARAVHAKEPDRVQATGHARYRLRRRDPCVYLHPERPVRLLALAACLRHLGGDLLADVRPQAVCLGRGEGLQLQPAVTAHDGDPRGLVVGHADLHLAAFRDGHLHAAEIDPVGLRHVVVHVPRAGHDVLARFFCGLTGQPCLSGLVLVPTAPPTQHL